MAYAIFDRTFFGFAGLLTVLPLPGCDMSDPNDGPEIMGTEGGTNAVGDSGGVMMSPSVDDCMLPGSATNCGSLRFCGDGVSAGGSSSGGEPQIDPECQAENDPVEACILEAAQAGQAFSYSNANTSDGGQYGTVRRVFVDADGSRSDATYEYEDLCADVTATLYAPVELSSCSDYACVDDRLRGAGRVLECGPETECGI